MGLITDIFDTAESIKDDRKPFRILAHTVSELGELSDELVISEGFGYKEAGVDGVVGEAIDAIICLFDIIHNHDSNITEDALQVITRKKLEKWKMTVDLRDLDKSF